ncbi:MAG TPA: DUF5987 family protein [Thermoleophilaceae bacterium]|nr:DUF5987 family protein [Thermoleophilaceae bacterium]
MSAADPHAALRAELSRRGFIVRAGALGAGALIVSALPVADRILAAADPAHAAVSEPDGTLQAFADTILPGRRVERTDTGGEIHPKAIAGADPEPGAVEADSLRLYHDDLLGFDALAPAFLADLGGRALARGGAFLDLGFEDRVAVVLGGLDFGNADRVVWEAAAAIPFVAFCAAGSIPEATSETASGYRVMGFPGTAPRGYQRSFSYRRRLNRGVTRRGNLP